MFFFFLKKNLGWKKARHKQKPTKKLSVKAFLISNVQTGNIKVNWIVFVTGACSTRKRALTPVYLLI